MKLSRDYLTSRFRRRVFGLLIIVVIIPVAIASFIAVTNLEQELQRQAEKRLHQSAKDYGLSVLQRLSAVRHEAALLDKGDPTTTVMDLPFRFADDNIEDLTARSLHPIRPAALNDPGTGRPLLFVTGPAPQLDLYMVRRDGSSPTALRVDLDYLWGPESYLPVPELCVTGYEDLPLYCSNPTATALLAAAAPASHQSLFEVEEDGRLYFGYARDLFLPSEFESTEWAIHVFQPARQALSPARSFKLLFTPAIVALIAGTLLVGVIQFRRRLQPLQRLVAGSRRVAEQDFSTRIEVRSGDEFEDLAGAFNNMTRSIGNQIGILRTLSSIDKTILETLDFDVVSAHVLQGLRELTAARCAAIGAVDEDSPAQGQFHILEHDAADITKIRAYSVFPDRDWGRHAGGLRLALSDLPPPMLDKAHASGAQWCFAVPFMSEDQVDGVLYLGFADSEDLDAQTRRAAEDFSDRLAVAMAAVKKERLLQKQANFDALTGLPNRLLLRDRLERSLIHARRANSRVAVMFLDLDRFKLVNDTLGHTSGDQLLVEAAARLTACVGEGDTVARLGGDEFVVVLTDLESTSRIVQVADTILERTATPFQTAEREMLLGVSIGIALFPQDGETTEELLRNADTAMYEAKDGGRGRYFFFDHGMNARLKQRARMESDLWRAVQNDELELWYQPQIDLTEKHIRGAEALIRWRHPERGLVSPDEFIPVAEDVGLIETIGARALSLACRDFQHWRKSGLELERIAVNVSPLEFSREGYVERVGRVLREYAMPPLCLVLEITENLLIHDTERVRGLLNQLRDLGVSFSIDDFGTGYSSLRYLQRLPIDTLKIDRSFIRDLTTNIESQAIVAAILDMSDRLGLDVVAEGVETEAQLDYLRACGCKRIQGYVYSQPLHRDEFLAFIATPQN